MTAMIKVGELTALPLDASHLAPLHHLCVRAAEFYGLIGDEAAAETAAAEILGLLDEPYARGTKHVFGLFGADELFAVADLLQDYPTPGDWVIGLLLVDPLHRRRGIGRQFVSAFIDWIVESGGAAVRLVVQHQNVEALAFWKLLGFEIEGETETVVGQRASVAWVLVNRLHA